MFKTQHVYNLNGVINIFVNIYFNSNNFILQ